MKLTETTFKVEFTAEEVRAIADALKNDCSAIGKRITELTETGTGDRDQDALTIANLKKEYQPKKALRDSLGSLVGTRYMGNDY